MQILNENFRPHLEAFASVCICICIYIFIYIYVLFIIYVFNNLFYYYVNPPIHSQQIRILHKTNKKLFVVNCWPSGKYVHVLYMYSILGRGSSCFNYCLNSAWRGVAWRWSVCGTAEVVWKTRFLWQWPSAHLHFLVSCFSYSSWQNP